MTGARPAARAAPPAPAPPPARPRPRRGHRRGARGGGTARPDAAGPWRTGFFALAGVAVVAGVAWVLLGDRVFVVRSITVTGTHLVSAAQVHRGGRRSAGHAAVAGRRRGGDPAGRGIPQVASATVTVDWPDHVAIAVTERVPVLAVRMADGGYDLVDPSGVIVL